MNPFELPFGANLAIFVASAIAVWFAGSHLARYADAIAERTGIGREFLGIIMLGGVTSLPELAVATSATLQGTPLLVDALSPGEPVLSEAGAITSFGALMALVLTALYLIGMLERRDRTILRMGYDSVAVIVAYFGGVAVLYGLR